jgi:hypothetical protein
MRPPRGQPSGRGGSATPTLHARRGRAQYHIAWARDLARRDYFAQDHPQFREDLAQLATAVVHASVPQALKDNMSRLLRFAERAGSGGDDDRLVFDALDVFGPDSLWCNPWRNPRFSVAVEEELRPLRAVVRQRITAWHGTARFGATVADRRVAARHLRRVGSVLAGNQRGKRGAGHRIPVYVRFRYVEALYRLERARHVLKHWPWGGSRAERLRQVAKATGVDLDDLCDFLGINASVERRSQPLPISIVARRITARALGVSEGRVRDLLSVSSK